MSFSVTEELPWLGPQHEESCTSGIIFWVQTMSASSASSTNNISRSSPDPELPRHLPGSTKGILDLTATRRQWVLEMDKDKQMVKLKESSHLPIPSCSHDKPCRRFLLAETRKRRPWKRKQRGQLVLHETRNG